MNIVSTRRRIIAFVEITASGIHCGADCPYHEPPGNFGKPYCSRFVASQKLDEGATFTGAPLRLPDCLKAEDQASAFEEAP